MSIQTNFTRVKVYIVNQAKQKKMIKEIKKKNKQKKRRKVK